MEEERDTARNEGIERSRERERYRRREQNVNVAGGEWRKGKRESGRRRKKFPKLAIPSELEASRFVFLDGAPNFCTPLYL